jgi:hypothetical protein
MPAINYGLSCTVKHLPEWLLGQTASEPLTQPRTSDSNKLPIIFCNAIGTTLTAILVGLSPVGHIEQPPTFVQTTQYTAPTHIVSTKENGALRGYKISSSQDAAVNEYLRQHPNSHDFLRDVAAIIDSIYGQGIIRAIHVVDDIDTGKPIMELAIQSGLPLDDEFIQKDQLLFQRIEESGLAWGFRDVVISQG